MVSIFDVIWAMYVGLHRITGAEEDTSKFTAASEVWLIGWAYLNQVYKLPSTHANDFSQYNVQVQIQTTTTTLHDFWLL